MATVKLESFGGIADGLFDNTEAFRSAFESMREGGGGMLILGSGVWSTGPIKLFSLSTLYLEEDAILSFIPEPERYPPVCTRWEGVECYAMHPLLFSSGQRDILITGKGRIEGNGSVWWDMYNTKRKQGQKTPLTPIENEFALLNPDYKTQPGGGGGREIQFLRPPLIQFYECQNVRLENVTIANSPFWTVHSLYCDNVVLSSVIVENPHDAPNTDGIDIDSCSNVVIDGCRVTVGDDGIALKSGSGSDGRRVNRPTCHVRIQNCTVGDGHGGIVIGSETAAGIFDVFAENCTFLGTDRGIRIKTRRGRGGEMYDLTFHNLVMERNLCPLSINMYYRCGASLADKGVFSLESETLTDSIPRIHDISISGIRATGCRASAGFIIGLPEAPIRNLVLEDCIFETDEDCDIGPDEADMFLGLPSVAVKSVRIRNVLSPVFWNVTVKGPEEAFIMM